MFFFFQKDVITIRFWFLLSSDVTDTDFQLRNFPNSTLRKFWPHCGSHTNELPVFTIQNWLLINNNESHSIYIPSSSTLLYIPCQVDWEEKSHNYFTSSKTNKRKYQSPFKVQLTVEMIHLSAKIIWKTKIANKNLQFCLLG